MKSGITLIALVVTIVVLLILAGITINFVMGDNGIFKTVESAKGKQKEAEYLEQIKIAVTNSRINENRKINTTVLENSLNNIQGISSIEKEDDENLPWTVSTNDGYKFQIKENETVEGVSGITLSETSLNLKKGENATLIVTFTKGVSGTVIWKSSDESIATVDDNGKVTAIAEGGTATITATVVSNGKKHEATCTITIKPLTVAEIVGEKQTEAKEIKDENGNKVVIPAGFRVLEHGTQNDDIDAVIYNYNETEHTPCVQDGIVIADDEDNQFVWIPVGDIKNKDNTTTTITLGRYIFNETTGEESLQQNADDYKQVVTIENMYQELVSNPGKLGAKDLEAFITRTKKSSGYYLARYEAGKGVDNGVISKKNKSILTSIYGLDMSDYSQNMYKHNSFIESDLVNSYAWDTAIIFIQKYSGNSSYSNTEAKTGRFSAGNNDDKVCNIHDMAGNYQECTTEYCTYRGQSGYYGTFNVWRGGMDWRKYSADVAFTAGKRSGSCPSLDSESKSHSYYSFRVIIY